MDFAFLAKTPFFRTLRTEEIKSALPCLGAVTSHFEKGSYIHRAGDKVHTVSLILKGCVNIAYDDIWGNRTILGQAHSGEIFAEAYACMDDEPLLISVEVAEDTEVLMMDMHKILTICPSNCSHHHKLVENLLTILARKNLGLSRRMVYTASKSIRGRVLSYLSFLADKQGKKQVSIPFDRQEMADFLGVDRSALSAELSRMQKDGLIAYKKNHFTLFTDEL